MIVEEKSSNEWYGNDNVNADQSGKAPHGVATETYGREVRPDLYETDEEDSIWKRAKMKRVKHIEE